MDESDFSACDDEESIFGDGDSLSEHSQGSVQVAREDIKLMNVVRAIVILILLTIAFVSAETVFVVATVAEENEFDAAYNDAAQQIIDGFYSKIETDLWTAQTLSVDLTSSASGEWPFITYSNFEQRCAGPRRLAKASTILFSPFVRRIELSNWQEYAELAYPEQNTTFVDGFNPHEGHPHEASGESVVYYPTGRDIEDGIYRFVDSAPVSDLGIGDFSFPIWQYSPPVSTMSTGLVGTLFNEMTNSIRGEALESMIRREGSVMSRILYQDPNGTDYASFAAPRSIIYYPIYDSLNTDKAIAGSLDLELQWEVFLEGILDNYNKPLTVLVDNKCGGTYSYEVTGLNATFIGPGDLHNDEVDGYTSTNSSYKAFDALFENHGKTPLDPELDCSFRVSIYATPEFKGKYLTTSPEIYKFATLGMFLGVLMIFGIYDCLIGRRQSRVVDAAERSDAIVRSFFPTTVRNRLYENAKQKQKESRKKNDKDWTVSNETPGAALESPRRKLRTFMKTDPGSEENQEASGGHNEPIADLFPNTTVLFADIAGFTAWSSEREPSQVFTLLETIYRSMDKAAKKLGVFKVETVGDCYVAATGIPEPQDNHAEIMVRFARSTLIRINTLTKSLEAQLGPGTSDLAMRFGIHSGPVTAGVLRGQKSRFQLFGDTMNMTARIETSGIKNKIHISQETAEILSARGKSNWFAPRPDLVHLKGKGECQTYWILLGNASSSHCSSVPSDDSDEMNKLLHPQPPRRGKRNTLSSIWLGSNLGNVLGMSEIDDRIQRLVNWNVDVLTSLLKRVVAQRIASGGATSRLSLESEKKIVGGESLVLDQVQMVIPLPDFDAGTAARAAQEQVDLGPQVHEELRDFVSCIATGYKRNAFHNFEHASHVILSATKLLKRIVAPCNVGGADQDKDITSLDVHNHTYGIGTDHIAQLAVVFSALIHDVGHTGVPNGQLAKEEPELAEKYVNKSIAEQRSVDIAWELLLLPHFENLRACMYQDETECRRFRHLVVNSVLATDIFDKELKDLRESRWDMAFHCKEEANSTETYQHHKATIVMEHLIQASDVSHTMQHWYIYLKWNERLFREIYFSFLLGRSEKDPSQGWYEGELWFFDNYVIPLCHKLQECSVFGVSSDEYLNYATQNRAEWMKKGRDICQNMLENAVKEAERMGLKPRALVIQDTPVALERIVEGSSVASASTNDRVEYDSSENEEVEPVVAVSAAAVETDTLGTAGSGSTPSAPPTPPTPSFSTRQVVAPPGRLGIVIDATAAGSVVHRVRPGSAMKMKLVPGDVITLIDGVETAGLSNSAISELMSARADQQRIFVVQSSR